jgi:hypothetical protein
MKACDEPQGAGGKENSTLYNTPSLVPRPYFQALLSICRAWFANFAIVWAWSWRSNNIPPGESSSQVRVLEQLK